MLPIEFLNNSCEIAFKCISQNPIDDTWTNMFYVMKQPRQQSTWGPPGSCRPQMGPMLAPMNLAIRECWLRSVLPYAIIRPRGVKIFRLEQNACQVYRHFNMLFVEWKSYFDSNLTEVCSQGSIWQWVSIESAVTWTKVDQDIWWHLGLLAHNILKLRCVYLFTEVFGQLWSRCDCHNLELHKLASRIAEKSHLSGYLWTELPQTKCE